MPCNHIAYIPLPQEADSHPGKETIQNLDIHLVVNAIYVSHELNVADS